MHNPNPAKQLQRLVLGFALFLTMSTAILGAWRAPKSGQSDLNAVWQRVQQAGAYHFSADVTQLDTPQASVLNAGRQSRQTKLHLEGQTDISAETLHLRLWSGGGSVQLPNSAAEMKVDGQTAMMRQGNGPWEEVDDFSGLFAPGGDFLGYTRAADNVVRHAPETVSTALGNVAITRYTFHINGRAFALQMQEQMRAQATRNGLPANVQVELPKIYAEMEGEGELWIGADGLPLRQLISLQFPPNRHDFASSAEIVVHFSDFDPLPSTALLAIWTQHVAGAFSLFQSAYAQTTLWSLALVGLFAWLVIRRRRSRRVYAAVVLTVMAAMVVTPLLTTQQLAAYSVSQTTKQDQQEAQRAETQTQRALNDQLSKPSVSPHQDPLAAAQGASAIDEPGRFADPLCESDPNGDADGDTLTNLSECLLGTLIDSADTDQDGLSDGLEVKGVQLAGQTWYTNPLEQDSNKDGLFDGREWYVGSTNENVPADTNGNGIPDVWDEDNDGDGVRDNLDLSPYTSTQPDGPNARLFTEDTPLQLVLNDLMADQLVKVEFQVVPQNPDHLWYTQNVLDWPLGDKQGQVQDADGATFFDVGQDLPPSPNANGDMRLVPMLEIQMAANTANLPPSQLCTAPNGEVTTCYPLLEQFGIAVQPLSADMVAAYVPLQMVTDSVGDNNVAFYGQMFYSASGAWGAPANVRMVWAVQVLNDICEAYKDNICSAYSAMNVPQIIQTYADEWYLSGIHVTEEHGADMALIYEDPQAFASAGVENDQPLYLETLYGLLYGLDNTFLAGADCDTTDGNGACVGNDQRDITVAELARRFERTTNGGVSATGRWNLPNVLRVDRQTYDSSDIGLLTTAVTETVRILGETYTPVWSASQPITPTIMMAYESVSRSVNLDVGLAGTANLAWSNQTLTLNFRQSGADAVDLSTAAVVKWAPYAYTATDGWAGADINQFYDNALASQLARDFDGAFPTQEENETYQTLAQVLYLAAYQGNLRLVEIGALINGQIQRQIIAQGYQQPSESIAATFITGTLNFIPKAMGAFITFSETWAQIAHRLTLDGEQATASTVISKFLSSKVFSLLKTAKGIVILLVGVAVVALLATAAVAKYILHSSSAVWGDILKYTIGTVQILISAILIIQSVRTIITWTQAIMVGLNVGWVIALGETLSASAAVTGSIRAFGLYGLIISIGIAIGFYIYAYASGGVQPGTMAANQLFATTLATIIVSVLLFALSVTVAGALLISIVGLVDLILTLAGVKWTITGTLIQYTSNFWYYVDLIADVNVDTGQLDMQVADPNLGIIASNRLTYTLPITTVITNSSWPTLLRYNVANNSVGYSLTQAPQHVNVLMGERKDDWIVSGSRTEVTDNISFSELPPVGINSVVPLSLNMGYALYTRECRFLLLCLARPIYGNNSVDLGGAVVLDVLPTTLDEFMKFGSWERGGVRGSVRAIDRDGDGLIAAQYGGVDPDDTTWDTDHDNLSDAYELTMRSRSNVADVGVLSPVVADTDGDGLNDDVEIRNATSPDKRDTDGDGLQDILEIPFFVNADGAPNLGGWALPYAYNAASGAVATTHVWSDPLQADGDGDGLTDLYERTRLTCPTCTPWADPANPEVVNPNVWNLSPVALYVEDNTVDGFVAPGESVVYTTTTENYLGSGQELVGELSLSVPTGVNGGPLAAPVNIANGERASLVSNLSLGGQNSATYDFTSHTQLTNLFETRWAWAQSGSTSNAILANSLLSVAVSPLTGWNGSHLVVTREEQSSGWVINAYVVESDGTVVTSRTLRSPSYLEFLNAPDVACNVEGICVAVWMWFQAQPRSAGVTALQLNGSLTNSQAYQLSLPGVPQTFGNYNISVATDGTNFMTAWTRSVTGTDGLTQIEYAPVTVNSGTGQLRTIANSTGRQAAAVAWNGTNYTLVWTGETTISWRSVAQDGALADDSIYSVAGDGWLGAFEIKRPPTLAHDAISGQTLLAYRSSAGELVARMVDDDTSAPFTLASAGLDGADVTVALAADRENGGWVAAWTPAGGGRAEYRAIAPSGALRGDIGSLDQAALTTVALSCIRPRTLLELPFNEAAGTTVFADASGNGNDAVCDGACPVSGVDGFAGNGVAFNGVDQALRVDGVYLANRSFTVAAWGRVDSASQSSTLLSMGNYDGAGKSVVLRINSNLAQCQLFQEGSAQTNTVPTPGTWHHWACIYDQPSKALTLYQDGAVVNSVTVKNGYTGNDTLRIGRQYNPSAPNAGFFFNGAVDSVTAVDRALSADEVAQLAQGALAAYSLDEPPGAEIFVNAIGSGLNGRCQSAAACPTVGAPGTAYTAATFDGQDDAILIGGQNETLTLANSSFTLSAWAKRAAAGQGHMILSQGSATTNKGLQFGFRPTNKFTCGFWNNDLDTSATYADTQWHHWVCTYDAASKRRTLYRDGVQVAQNTASVHYSGFGITYIGQRLDGAWRFKGTIDEVGIWNSALSADQVRTLYEKVKVADETVLTCQLPAAAGNQLTMHDLVLRQTTTELGEINQSIDRTITVDGDKPATAGVDTTYFSQSAPGPYVRSTGTLVFAGSAADDSSYIANVEVNAGAGWQVAQGAATWSYGWDTSRLSDGPHAIQVRATDAVGNQSNASSWHTILDTTAPNVSLNGPTGLVQPSRNAQGRWQLSVSGTVSDPVAGTQPGSGVAAVEVLLHGADGLEGLGWQAATLSGGAWSLDYVLPLFDGRGSSVADPSGVYTATVRATDAVDNITPAASYLVRSFTIDAEAPSVAASDSLSNSQAITTGLQIGGSVTDKNGVQAVEVNFTPGEQIGALEGNILHLPFDERHATAYFADQSGANNAAVCGSGQCPTVDAAGQRDRAVRFNGAGQYLTAPPIVDPAATAFSAAVWFQVDALDKPQHMLQQQDGSGTGRTWLALTPQGKVNSFLGGADLNSKSTIAPKTWHQAVITYDGTTLSLYVDGVLDNKSVRAVEASTGEMRIGANKAASQFYSGLLDELVIYDRALAAYEVLNLYGYGQGTWQEAVLEGNSWRYTMPAGEDGLEGLYQLNVRGIDVLGNATLQGGQRVWRGEIDTRPPQVTFKAELDTSGATPMTTYTCVAIDFNLVEGQSCLPVQNPPVPQFRPSDITLTGYDEVNGWYAETITDTARLYRIDALRAYADEPSAGQSVTACDAYGHCTEASEGILRTPLHPQDVEVLGPSTHTVLTATTPITISGDAFAAAGLYALDVTLDGVSLYGQRWDTDDVTTAAWHFGWTPPGEGIFHFIPFIEDWTGKTPPATAAAVPNVAAAQSAADAPVAVQPPPHLTERMYLPWVANGAPNPFGQATGMYLYLPLVPTESEPLTGAYTGTVTTLYVDLTPPTITIDADLITLTQALGDRVVLLTGSAADAVKLHNVEVRVNDGPWQRAGLDEDGRWQWLWLLDSPPDGETFVVSARATDIAGRTTTVTQTVEVDTVAPTPQAVALGYVNAAGEQLPVAPGDTLTDVTQLTLSWEAAAGGGEVQYRVGFSTSSTPQPPELTPYAQAGTHTIPVHPDERWYATVYYLDAVGNASSVTLGPLFIHTGAP
ncbi:MAG: hypothetical protein KDE54_00930 [Caldilineaceae bacterium]|nr:hypothetical protein [Caldilineaceae bacterium]MCB0140745.1 hypothetical protein [Caldilineaceae bacterium]